MKSKIGVLILAGAFLLAVALPLGAEEGGSGKRGGTGFQTQSGDAQPIGKYKRSTAGSTLDPAEKKSGKMKKAGNAPGPGDERGNAGAPAPEGTGSGSSSQKRVVLH
jgi:hypothetical protein